MNSTTKILQKLNQILGGANPFSFSNNKFHYINPNNSNLNLSSDTLPPLIISILSSFSLLPEQRFAFLQIMVSSTTGLKPTSTSSFSFSDKMNPSIPTLSINPEDKSWSYFNSNTINKSLINIPPEWNLNLSIVSGLFKDLELRKINEQVIYFTNTPHDPYIISKKDILTFFDVMENIQETYSLQDTPIEFDYDFLSELQNYKMVHFDNTTLGYIHSSTNKSKVYLPQNKLRLKTYSPQ